MLEALQGRLRKWFSCGCRQQRLPFGRRPARCIGRGPAHDVRLDHEVVWTTNHHKMFGIVTADEDDASFAVDREGFYYCYPRWCVAIAQPFEHGRSPTANAGQRNNMATFGKRADLVSCENYQRYQP